MNKKLSQIFFTLVFLFSTSTIFAQVPEITLQPKDYGIFGGESATFSVSATGSDTLLYQWKKNGVNIDGAIESSYTTPPATLADNGIEFSCQVTNGEGTVTSLAGLLFVTPVDERVSGGIQVLYDFNETQGNIINDVSSNGADEDIVIIIPEKTAWTPNGLETFADVITRTNNKGSKITANCNNSDEITIEVWIMPEFVAGQNSRRIFTYSLSGDFRNFSIIQDGGKYEFRLRTLETNANGEPGLITSSNATTNLTHLIFTRNRDGLANIYINGSLDTTTSIAGELDFSDNALLAIGSEPYGGLSWRGVFYHASVYDRALSADEVTQNYNIGVDVDNTPAFTIQPSDQYTLEGGSASFESYAVSVETISYQWKKNGVNISEATDRFLTLQSIGASDDGAEIQCIASTSSGIDASNTATLFVTPSDGRVEGILLYTFKEGSGNVINDVSNVEPLLNLSIFSPDAVVRKDDGLKIISAPSIITTTSASKIISLCQETNEITVEAWITPANSSQSGPANIFSHSADENNRNFTLSQDGDKYKFALRTSDTDANGEPSLSTTAGTVSTTGYDHVVFTRESNGTTKLYLNGTERISSSTSGDFSNWNTGYLLALANEFSVDKHWKGLVNLVAVYNRALIQSEVLRNYNFAPYSVVIPPTSLSLISNDLGKIKLDWNDNSTNERIFVIERSMETTDSFSFLDSVNVDISVFIDSTIVDNRDYFYRVKAINDLTESVYSDTLSVHSLTTPLLAPSNLNHTINEFGLPDITWQDNSTTETNFVIERRTSSAGANFSVVDTVGENVTAFTDLTVSDSTTYVYRIYAFNADTLSTYSDDLFIEVLTGLESEDALPEEFSLAQNFPNPFNPSTKISFGLPENADVTLRIFNLLGQEVLTILDEEFSAGNHTVEFNASNFTSGIYIYTISASGSNGNDFKTSKKMILMK